MRQSLMLEFDVKEYERRIEKLVKKMNESNINAVILTSDENTFYFSGFNSIVWDSKVSTPAIIVITDDGHLTVATTPGGVATATVTSCADDIRTYGKDGYKDYIDAVVSVLEEKKLMDKNIGFEFGSGHKMHLNYTLSNQLFARLKDADCVDAASVLWAVRSVKSPAEVERIRECCRINTLAIQKGLDEVKEGTTEMELYRNIAAECFRLGAENTLVYGVRAGKERYSQGNCPPSHRPIREGEIILIDGGPIYHGYFSDIIREAVIGKPTDRQQEIFDVAREALYVGLEAVKPGVTASSVCKAVDDFMDSSKFADINVYKNWCGHGIGVGVHECPMLDSVTHTVLEPGMTFSIEPYIYEEGVGSLGVEQNFLVTETGYEILTPSRDELIRL